MQIVFMGSAEFSIPSLLALADRYAVRGVVTRPDRPAGRGRLLRPPPVKLAAAHRGLDVFQPERLRDPAAVERLRSWQPDVIVVAAFGEILRKEVLELAPHGCLNIHASLLPRWRGAAPVQAAILNGDAETGVTIMRMDPGLDSGPIVAQRSTPVHPEETAGDLSERLAELGAELLLEALPGYVDGQIALRPQDESLATYAPSLKKQDGLLDWRKPADELARQVRAFHPWPGSFTLWDGRRLLVLCAVSIGAEGVPSAPGGTIFIHAGSPAVVCGLGALSLQVVQPEGRRPMAGSAFLAGAPEILGQRLRSGPLPRNEVAP